MLRIEGAIVEAASSPRGEDFVLRPTMGSTALLDSLSWLALRECIGSGWFNTDGSAVFSTVCEVSKSGFVPREEVLSG